MNNIRVAGIDYEIQYLSSEEMNGNIGLADFNNQKIMINIILGLSLSQFCF